MQRSVDHLLAELGVEGSPIEGGYEVEVASGLRPSFTQESGVLVVWDEAGFILTRFQPETPIEAIAAFIKAL